MASGCGSCPSASSAWSTVRPGATATPARSSTSAAASTRWRCNRRRASRSAIRMNCSLSGAARTMKRTRPTASPAARPRSGRWHGTVWPGACTKCRWRRATGPIFLSMPSACISSNAMVAAAVCARWRSTMRRRSWKPFPKTSPAMRWRPAPTAYCCAVPARGRTNRASSISSKPVRPRPRNWPRPGCGWMTGSCGWTR